MPTDGNISVYVDSEDRMWFPPVRGGLWWMKDGRHGSIALDGLNKDVVYSIAGKKGELWLGRQQGWTSLSYAMTKARFKPKLILTRTAWLRTVFSQRFTKIARKARFGREH